MSNSRNKRSIRHDLPSVIAKKEFINDINKTFLTRARGNNHLFSVKNRNEIETNNKQRQYLSTPFNSFKTRKESRAKGNAIFTRT
jgi:hypothetical protein